MLFDHVPLRVIQLKVAVGIAQSRSGMPKAVQPVRGVGRVPIVEEIIVQRLEHQDFRWITPGEIDDVVFCPADVDVLAKIKAEFPAGGAN